jgi:deoxyribonuclease V
MKKNHSGRFDSEVHPPYNLTRFARTQTILARCIREEECGQPERIAGVDVAYSGRAYTACVVCNKDLVIIESNSYISPIHFPYIPTFFSYREFPPLMNVLRNMEFDILFVHGHGRAHPRLFGLACHVGLLVRKPTIGIASGLICGEIVGDNVIYKGNLVGRVWKKNIVSVGNLITLENAYAYTVLFSPHGVPLPLRYAHNLTEKLIKYRK